jgi:hypothetical protein
LIEEVESLFIGLKWHLNYLSLSIKKNYKFKYLLLKVFFVNVNRRELEEFENTKGEIKIRKSKERQHIMAKRKRRKGELTIYKTCT